MKPALRLLRLLRRLVGAGILVWLVTWGGVVLADRLWPRDAPFPETADAVICLGGGMSYNGWERPGPASTRRALTCAELVRAGVAPVAVFTGTGHEVISAAEAMANLARDAGLPEDAILVEPRARSTLQNAALSYGMLPGDIERVVIVSDPFHLPRSWALFSLVGEAEVETYAARMRYSYDDGQRARGYLAWTLRESVAVLSNVLRVGIYLLGALLGVSDEARNSWFEPV
jgi:uncharacterized SAM-binding protein YcdF (DUF218 family)